jgi:hypothetical protein
LIFGFIARLFFWRNRWGGPSRSSDHRWKDGTNEYDHPLGNKFVEWHQHAHSKEQPPQPDTDDGS